MAAGASVTELLAHWRQGSPDALDALTPLVHRELRNCAELYLRRRRNYTLQPTALVNEAWLRLLNQTQPPLCENRVHFFGIAARLMRLVLVDYARTHNAAKRGGSAERITLDESELLCTHPPADILEVNQALDQFAAIDPRKAQVLELRYFAGMSRDEIAAVLSLTTATVKRDLRLGEAWLARFLTRPHRL